MSSHARARTCTHTHVRTYMYFETCQPYIYIRIIFLLGFTNQKDGVLCHSLASVPSCFRAPLWYTKYTYFIKISLDKVWYVVYQEISLVGRCPTLDAHVGLGTTAMSEFVSLLQCRKFSAQSDCSVQVLKAWLIKE